MIVKCYRNVSQRLVFDIEKYIVNSWNIKKVQTSGYR